MNCINSLIVEGVVVGEPHYLEATQIFEFAIDSTRYKKGNGKGVTEHNRFDIVSYGDYGKLLFNKLKNGTGTSVRVVGRLKQDEWEDSDGVSHSKVYIVAEHTEIRSDK